MTSLLSKLFIKNYKDTADPRVRAAYGTMASVVGILFNLLLFAAKITVGLLFGAISIVGDAVNNLSDAGSQIISLITFRIAAKPADRKHPFGHGRIEYVASMIVSFFVITIGFELLRESIGKILDPTPPESSWVSVAVLFGSILVKIWLGLFNRGIGKRIDSSVMRATATDSFSDAISTGVVLVAALVLLLFPNLDLNLDAYMGVAVSVLILVAGLRILWEAKDAILGEAPSDEIVEQITRVVAKYPDALGIHDMTVHNYGPGRVIAALHIEVDGKKDIFETHDMIDNIEKELRLEHGIETTIHMDPIITDDEQVSALRERVLCTVREIDPTLQIHDFRFVAGKTHTNLIFDVAVPFECKLSDEEVRRAVADKISALDATYFAVLTIDRT